MGWYNPLGPLVKSWIRSIDLHIPVIDGCDLVIAASDDSLVNRQAAELCRERQILVNHAGDKGLCDFYFPGIAREGNLVAGVTASGKDHRMASEVTGRLQSWLKQFARG